MKLVKLDLACPAVFAEIVEKIQSFGRKNPATNHGKTATVIGGGALYDLYEQKPILDIDVFTTVRVHDLEQLSQLFGGVSVHRKQNDDPNHYDSQYFTQVLSFQYKGYEVDLIEVVSIHRIWDFDFRFRQFYFLDGAAYASEDALADIKAKRLVIVNPHSCLSTFCRAYYFEARYGFAIDRKSFQLLQHFINFKAFPRDYVMSYIRRYEKLPPEKKQQLLHTLSGNELSQPSRLPLSARSSDRLIPVNEFKTVFRETEGPDEHFDTQHFLHFPDVEPVLPPSYQDTLFEYLHTDHVNERIDVGLMGKKWDRIMQYQPPALPEPFSFSFSVQENLPYFKELLSEFRFFYLKKRLRLLTKGEHEMVSVLQQLVDQPFTEQTMHAMVEHQTLFFDFFKDAMLSDIEQTIWHDQTANRFRSLALKDRNYTVSFHSDEESVRLADITEHLVFVAHLHEQADPRKTVYRFLFRKCENGKYTISSSIGTNDSGSSSPFAVMKHLMKLLADRYPQWFTLATPETKALFSRQSIVSEYFFNGLQDATGFSNHAVSVQDAEENEYLSRIRNIQFQPLSSPVS